MIGTVNSFLEAVGQLRFRHLRFTLEAQAEAVLPSFLGSTLRGGLAMACKQMHCTQSLMPCDACRIQRHCLYPLLFETASSEGEQEIKRLRDTPHPLVIEPPLRHCRRFTAGDRFAFGLLLLGPAIDKIPHFIFAASQMAQVGLGSARVPFRLLHVTDEAGRVIFDADTPQIKAFPASCQLRDVMQTQPTRAEVQLQWVTPLRLKADQKILTESLPLDVLWSQMLRRLSALLTFYGTEPASEGDFYHLLHDTAMPQKARQNLRWTPLQRYSNRQKKKLNIGGFTGSLDLQNLPPAWWPVLLACSVVHTGKATVMGLGQLELRAFPTESGEQRNRGL